MIRLLRPAPILLAAALLALVTIALLWPGVITFDGVAQYGQAVSGQYDDWHPPIMARLWAALRAAGLPGSGPLLLLQWAMLWCGAGLAAAALARSGAPRAGVLALAAPLFPVLASWMACVLKDSQLVGALALAAGLVAWFRFGPTGRLPVAAQVGVALLLAYATLLRANAAFSAIPLALAWSGWLGVRRRWARAALLVAGCGAAIAVTGPVNHRLLGAEPSLVERTLPVFDMAGTAHFAHLDTLPGLPAATWAQAERRDCYTPFFWDRLGDPERCLGIATTLAFDRDDDAPSIIGDWLKLIARHPLGYLEHRFAHLDATFRLVAPADERLATGPARSLPNRFAIGLPDTQAATWLATPALWAAESPLGVPAWWLVVALLAGWVALGSARRPARDMALALIGSALVQWGSFAVVSIASDLRYHLWPMLATILGVAFAVAGRDLPRRRMRASLIVAMVAALASVVLRASVSGQLG